MSGESLLPLIEKTRRGQSTHWYILGRNILKLDVTRERAAPPWLLRLGSTGWGRVWCSASGGSQPPAMVLWPTFADKTRLSQFLVYSARISQFPTSHVCAAFSSMAKLVKSGQRMGSEEKKLAEALLESFVAGDAFKNFSNFVVVGEMGRLLRNISRLGVLPRPAVQHALLDRIGQSIGPSGALASFEQGNMLMTCEEWGVEPSGNLRIALGLQTAPPREAPKVEPQLRRKRSRSRSPARQRDGAGREGGRGGGGGAFVDTGGGGGRPKISASEGGLFLKECHSFRALLRVSQLDEKVGSWDHARIIMAFQRVGQLRQQGGGVGADEKAFVLSLTQRTSSLAADFSSTNLTSALTIASECGVAPSPPDRAPLLARVAQLMGGGQLTRGQAEEVLSATAGWGVQLRVNPTPKTVIPKP